MVVLVGWSINGLIQVYLRATGTDPISAWFIAAYAGLPVNIACSSNYFVLYYFSKDYRTAFRRQLNGITQTLFGKDIVSMEGDTRIQNITITNTNTGDRKNSRVQAATHH
uniref:G-protein coupled receptors family 1 profile domain-containing protein n=1 Tax=Panagrolaimus sp. PS1159 TaxID=55785 RepID=A0AC35F5Z4_9BILA